MESASGMQVKQNMPSFLEKSFLIYLKTKKKQTKKPKQRTAFLLLFRRVRLNTWKRAQVHAGLTGGGNWGAQCSCSINHMEAEAKDGSVRYEAI